MLKLPDSYINNNPQIIDRVNEDLAKCNNMNYLFVGKTGIGKSYLAELIMDSINGSRQFYTAKSLVNKMSIYKTNKFADYPEKLRFLFNARFVQNLVIDDIGTEENTDKNLWTVGSFIQDRCDYLSNAYQYRDKRRHKPLRTILTTNLSSEQMINNYGIRLWDRLKMCFVIMVFNDCKSFRNNYIEVLRDGQWIK